MTTSTTQPLSVSDSAARRISALIARNGQPDAKLRISVSGGGCSGFQYGFSFDAETREDDIVIHDKGVTVVVDTVSLPFLEGSVIDFVESLAGSAFQVKNPNAASSCGCGSSFSI